MPTIDAFGRCGMLGAVAMLEQAKDGSGRSVADSAHWLQQPRRPAGHFAGLQFDLDKLDIAKWPHRLAGVAATGMTVTMGHLGNLLTARAAAMGAAYQAPTSP